MCRANTIIREQMGTPYEWDERIACARPMRHEYIDRNQEIGRAATRRSKNIAENA